MLHGILYFPYSQEKEKYKQISKLNKDNVQCQKKTNCASSKYVCCK